MDFLRVVTDAGMLIRQREKLGMTQEQVAAKAGIRPEQYRMYESSENRFSSTSMRIVNAVLTALELDPTAFANGDYVFEPISEDDPHYELLSKIESRNQG